MKEKNSTGINKSAPLYPMIQSDFLLRPTIIFLLHYPLLLDSFPVDTNTEVLREGGERDLCSKSMYGSQKGWD